MKKLISTLAIAALFGSTAVSAAVGNNAEVTDQGTASILVLETITVSVEDVDLGTIVVGGSTSATPLSSETSDGAAPNGASFVFSLDSCDTQWAIDSATGEVTFDSDGSTTGNLSCTMVYTGQYL